MTTDQYPEGVEPGPRSKARRDEDNPHAPEADEPAAIELVQPNEEDKSDDSSSDPATQFGDSANNQPE